MANVRIIFYGRGISQNNYSAEIECELECNEIALSIKEGDRQLFVSLDKSTAIRLAKKLRTEISKMGEEVYNG